MGKQIVDSPLLRSDMSIFIGKPILGLITLSIATVVRLLQKGGLFHYGLLLVGSILSITEFYALKFLVCQVSEEEGKIKRGLVPMLIGFGGLIPYLFGCYLFFFEGLWRLLHAALIRVFSVRSLVLSVLFTILGFIVVNSDYKISEFLKELMARKNKVLDE